MTVRSNGFFNNPAFAQAASNLASLFEPPSGADAAGWASADAKRAEAKRLQDFFDYQTGADYDPTVGDRMGVGAGVYGWNQSHYAVDQGDATTRRGQDVAAQTSRQNNAADNARAMELGQLSELQKLFGPLNEGQIRPELPEDIAGRFGVDHGLRSERGLPKVLTDEQVKGQVMQGMPQELQEAITFGSTPIEPVVTPEGPRNATRLDAIGQQPFVKDSGGLTVTTNPDGTTTVTQGGGKITEAGGKKINYATTAEAMLPIMNEIGDELASLQGAAADSVPLVGNYAQTEKYQQARIAGERFTQVILRNESGAATPDAEIAKYMGTFLPAPGDKPGTIKLKAYLRKVAVEALKGGMSLDERKNAIDAAIAAGVPADFGVDLGTSGAPAAPAPAAPAPAAPPAGGAPAAGPARYERRDGKIVRVQ